MRVLLVNTEKVRLEYYVPMNRFLSDANSWSPAQGPFPVNLADHFQKARQHLVQTRSLRGKVTLSAVSMHMMGQREIRQTSGRATYGPFLERWVISYTFSAHDRPENEIPHESLIVAILLDGTIAEERLIRGSGTRISSAQR